MQNIKTLAYRFLLETQINELNISITTLRNVLKKQNIFLLKYSEVTTIKGSIPEETYGAVQIAMQKNDAVSLQADNLTVVLYSDDLPYGKKLQRICHEIGHIKAEHRRTETFMFEPNEEQEREADAFSFYVMAPPCIIKQLCISSEQDVSSIAGLHRDDVKRALFYIRKDRGSKSFSIEKNLIHQFEQFINANRSNKRNIKKIVVAAAVILGICGLSFYLHNAYNGTTAEKNQMSMPAVITPQALPTPTPTIETSVSSENNSETTVWKAKTGYIYHTDPDCYHIPKTARTMDLEEAISNGYRKCKDCKK